MYRLGFGLNPHMLNVKGFELNSMANSSFKPSAEAKKKKKKWKIKQSSTMRSDPMSGKKSFTFENLDDFGEVSLKDASSRSYVSNSPSSSVSRKLSQWNSLNSYKIVLNSSNHGNKHNINKVAEELLKKFEKYKNLFDREKEIMKNENDYDDALSTMKEHERHDYESKLK